MIFWVVACVLIEHKHKSLINGICQTGMEGAPTVCECYAWPASWREEGAHYRERSSGHISAWGPMVRTQCTRVTACGRVAGSDTPTILGFASLCSLEHFHHSNVQLAIACCGLGVDCLGELTQNLGNIQDKWISIVDDKYGYLLDPIFVLSYTLYSLRQSLANASFLDCLDFTSSFCLIGLV